MPSHAQIRRAEPDDAPAIWAAHRASVLGLAGPEYGQDEVAAWLDVAPDAFRRAIADGDETFFVAEVGGDVVGFASVRGDEVRAVYVRPDAARQGLGTRLLDAVEREARAQGVDRLRGEASLNAVAFWAAKGYAESGRGVMAVRGGRLPIVRVEKELRAHGEARD